MANGLALKGSMEKLAPGGGLSLSLCVLRQASTFAYNYYSLT